MRIVFHRGFKKKYKKLKTKEQKRVQQRLRLFVDNPASPVLNIHELKGAYQGYLSMNMGGDLRALFHLIKKDIAFFIAIDTHNNLYE